MEKTTLCNVDLENVKKLKSGKVREIFEIDSEKLLIVATDRISAFDWILPSCIPFKGIVLTQLSNFWFHYLSDIIKNHLIHTEISEFPVELKNKYSDILKQRSVIVKKLNVFPVEFIVRGYITGSGWKEYKEKGEICGIKLPKGLKESEKLPEPIFTPTTKAELGKHDENITFEQMVNIIGDKNIAEKLREISIKLYLKASEYAESRGIIIADTKFEFGYDENGEIYLIDEVLTPDSSRFWLKEEYKPGVPQNSFDKQFVRDYLSNVAKWDKNSPPPPLPQDVIEATSQRYIQIYKWLTGKDIS